MRRVEEETKGEVLVEQGQLANRGRFGGELNDETSPVAQPDSKNADASVFRGRWRTFGVILGSILAASLTFPGAISSASIPDANGLVHGCYTKGSAHKLSVYDSAIHDGCPKSVVALNWNQLGPQGNVGTQGPQGPQGPPGPPGLPGSTNFSDNVYSESAIYAGEFVQLQTSCPSGSIPISGGVEEDSAPPFSMVVVYSYPSNSSWIVGVYNNGLDSAVFDYADCVSPN